MFPSLHFVDQYHNDKHWGHFLNINGLIIVKDILSFSTLTDNSCLKITKKGCNTHLNLSSLIMES